MNPTQNPENSNLQNSRFEAQGTPTVMLQEWIQFLSQQNKKNNFSFTQINNFLTFLGTILNGSNDAIILFNSKTKTLFTSSVTIDGTSVANQTTMDFSQGRTNNQKMVVVGSNGMLWDLSHAAGSLLMTWNSPGGAYDFVAGIIRLKKNDNSSTIGVLTTDSAGTPTQFIVQSNGHDLILADAVSNGQSLIIKLPVVYLTGEINDLASGGAIGTAGTTVDIESSFTINQTTAGQTLSLPSPTNTTAGRICYITNIGSTSFMMLGKTVSTSSGLTAMWNGSAWACVGSGG